MDTASIIEIVHAMPRLEALKFYGQISLALLLRMAPFLSLGILIYGIVWFLLFIRKEKQNVRNAK